MVPRVRSETVWFHAVSVGEVLSLERIIAELKQRYPDHAFYVTTGTLTGLKVANEQLHPDIVSLAPFDFLPAVALAFRRIRPRALVLVEAELWPNMLAWAALTNVPVFMINARLRMRSGIHGWLKGLIMWPLLSCITHIFTQTQADVERFCDVGMPVERLSYVGDIKAYNVLAKKKLWQERMNVQADDSLKIISKGPLLLVGSVHPGEISHYLNLYDQLKKEFPTLKMILAPRHFYWKDELFARLNVYNHRFTVLDEQTIKPGQMIDFAKLVAGIDDIIVLCTIGVMFGLYQFADIYYLGGTFVPVGGHNVLEPTAWGKPTVVGPFYRHVADVVDQLEKIDGIIKVADDYELAIVSQELLQSPERRTAIAAHARAWLEQQAAHVEQGLQQLFDVLR